MTADKLNEIEEKIKTQQATISHKVCVCMGAGCLSSGGQEVLDGMKKTVEEKGLKEKVNVIPTGCMGACNQGPLVKIMPDEVMYEKVESMDLAPLVEDHLIKGQIKREKLIFAGMDGEVHEKANDTAFYRKQLHIATENCGTVDPESIEEYIAIGGYRALHKAITELSSDEVVAEVSTSGLRGRGGAGFPVGKKWQMVQYNFGDQKFVVCNGDEGDPGAFMDRSILEGDPHRVIEGMAIAGFAVGAHKGYLYVRAEYPLAIARFDNAIKQARRNRVLGASVFGTEFDFDIEIRVGAGAFVCGEETALINSIQGERGTPRPRPPYPAESGLWGYPTLINNVETLANIAPIVQKGGEWFASIGTETSKGTKVFALAGKVVNTGLIEVPMGLTLKEIIFEIGGGIPNGKKFKAAQTGGPSGGCIPEDQLDVHVDYDNLMKLGSIMGSGGLIVMDEDSCMVDVARFFMEFCMDESCGKCVPCRVGTKHMYDLLTKICNGQSTPRDLKLLEELAPMVKDTSLCGLGMTAPNPLLSTLKYFRHEYEAHIHDKRCPAGVCRIGESAKTAEVAGGV